MHPHGISPTRDCPRTGFHPHGIPPTRANNAFFLDTIGWIEFKRTNYNEAVFYLEKSVAILPKSSEILDHLGDFYLMLGRKDEAIFEWKKAIKYEKDKYVIRNIREKLIKYE